MGDAEIIPIGTRGRPGRGTGQAAVLRRARPGRAGREARRRRASRPRGRVPARPPTRRTEAETAVAEGGRGRPVGHPRPRTTPGIPASDWLAALQHAAREVFGDHWEPRLAEFLAFLRRRVTGDYAVDEYGFDAEITERFLMAALRPIAESGSASRSAASRTSRPRAAPWSSPTTRARSRSTG